jgi:hypothetical protein
MYGYTELISQCVLATSISHIVFPSSTYLQTKCQSNGINVDSNGTQKQRQTDVHLFETLARFHEMNTFIFAYHLFLVC